VAMIHDINKTSPPQPAPMSNTVSLAPESIVIPKETYDALTASNKAMQATLNSELPTPKPPPTPPGAITNRALVTSKAVVLPKTNPAMPLTLAFSNNFIGSIRTGTGKAQSTNNQPLPYALFASTNASGPWSNANMPFTTNLAGFTNTVSSTNQSQFYCVQFIP